MNEVTGLLIAKCNICSLFQVFPLAHVNGNKKLITLINPQAVNLADYKEKLEHAIKSYERYILHLKYPCTRQCSTTTATQYLSDSHPHKSNTVVSRGFIY